MPESHAARGTRRASRSLATLGDELRAARLSAGVSLAVVATATGLSASEVSRIERGSAPWLSVLAAGRVAAVVGLDLVVRAYPGGDAVRDAAHLRLLAAFRDRLHARLRVRTEVPIGPERDQRTWDATVSDGTTRFGVELETRITDAQALVRRVNLKLRDSGLDRAIVVASDTNANRGAVAAARPLLDLAFPLTPDQVLAALRTGHVPEAGGLLLIRLDRVHRVAARREL